MKSYEGEDRRIDKFFNLSLDLLCIASLDGYFLDVNPAFMRTLGHSKEVLLSVKFLEFVHPEDVQATLDELEKLGEGRKTLYFENRYRCKNGSYKWLGWTSVPANQVIYAIARDLTNQKKTENALRESQDKLLTQTRDLEQKNIALQEVLSQIEQEKNRFKQEVSANIEELVLPIVNQLKRRTGTADRRHLAILEKNLRTVTAAFGQKISRKTLKLTPKEVEICNMIRGGLSSKDIARILNISQRTVDNHRNSIRTKLKLSGKKTNLATYLKSL